MMEIVTAPGVANYLIRVYDVGIGTRDAALTAADFVYTLNSAHARVPLDLSAVAGVYDWWLAERPTALSALTSTLLNLGYSRSLGDFAFCSHFAELDETLAEGAEREADRALQQLSGDLGRAVSARLHELIALAREEDSPASLPSPQSFRALVDFLVQNRELVRPGIALDDEGLVWAEWRQSPNCLAALRFRPDGSIQWTIVTPAPLRGSGRVTWFGDGEAKDVRAAIDARPALSWMVRRAFA